jgi:GntR family carbon starvation induced transcriptional regulator
MNKFLSSAELAWPNETSSRTLASALVGRITADIIDGTLVPGERLRLPDLSARYDCGISPLREALARLSSTGLVDQEDQKGFRVSTVSREDLSDLTEVRTEIECLALRRSIEWGNLEWETRVVSAHHRLSRIDYLSTSNARELSSDWEAAHQEFHLALVSACQSRWLLQFRNILAQQTARYRRLIVTIGMGKRDVVDEHAQILNAALGRDAEQACALIAAHFLKTTETVLSASDPNTKTKSGRKSKPSK